WDAAVGQYERGVDDRVAERDVVDHEQAPAGGKVGATPPTEPGERGQERPDHLDEQAEPEAATPTREPGGGDQPFPQRQRRHRSLPQHWHLPSLDHYRSGV